MSRVPFVRCASEIVEADSSALMIIPRAIRKEGKNTSKRLLPSKKKSSSKQKEKKQRELVGAVLYSSGQVDGDKAIENPVI